MNYFELYSIIQFPFPFHPNLNKLNPEITLSKNITKGYFIINGHFTIYSFQFDFPKHCEEVILKLNL